MTLARALMLCEGGRLGVEGLNAVGIEMDTALNEKSDPTAT